MTTSSMLMVGLMSGTSLDGVDAALVRIDGPLAVRLVAFVHREYGDPERQQIERVLAGSAVAEAAALHAALAEWAAEAVDAVLAAGHVRADQVGGIAFPGQTIWHQPPVVSWQLGEPAILAERFGVRVVHNFRSRDVAAGGQGAPLVPLVDALCFGGDQAPRILLNLGGMANVTWVRRRGELDGIVGADTGPGMAIIDALAQLHDPALRCDLDGRLAAAGVVHGEVLEELLADPFFQQPPPRSTGREQFGREYARRLHAKVGGADAVRTAVALTVESIARCCERFLPPAREMVASGGGTRHPVLMELLARRLAERGTTLHRFDDLFFPAHAKEAVAFALLAWLTLHGQPGNVPAVTGALGDRVLGSVTPP